MLFFCRLRHRGPDWSGLFVGQNCWCYLAHERLAIIDPASGDQPLYNDTKDIVVAVSCLLLVRHLQSTSVV
jgi:asparagine synthase (glutamine-hydrolysing)